MWGIQSWAPIKHLFSAKHHAFLKCITEGGSGFSHYVIKLITLELTKHLHYSQQNIISFVIMTEELLANF